MVNIIFDKGVMDVVVNAPIKESKIILKGPTGSGKSTILLERYKHMVEKLGVPSEKILILLLNRAQSLNWRSKTVLSSSGAIWRTSYYGFIQAELKTYYPIILKHCNQIKNRRLRPIFLTFESAQFLVSKVIKQKREKLGMFSGVVSYNDRIAIDLTSNIVKAATSDIPFDEIGKRLYNSLELKDENKKAIYDEADSVLVDYRKRCFELGVFDFGMAVDLYNNYLLRDETYKKKLFDRVQHVIVDNIEECVPTEIDFIEFLRPNVTSLLLSYNNEGGYGEVFGSNHEYVKQKILNGYKIINTQKTLTSKDYMTEFSDMLYGSIIENYSNKDINFKSLENEKKIERNSPSELRSDMLDRVGGRICKLILEEGYKPSDITVISTYADPVTEFVLDRILENKGIGLKNLTRKNRVIDNPFTQALMTLAQLSHPDYKLLPHRDDVKALIMMLLRIDPVRSSILADEICSQRPFAEFPDVEFPGLVERIGYYNVEKYESIRNWISRYKARSNPLPINEFLQKVFLEILLSDSVNDNDILQAKNLIDSSQTFVDVVSRFMKNASKGFLDMLRGGIKSAESIFELEEKIEGDFVLLSTPVAYLASSLNSKVIILTSISSSNWTPRSIKEMTNVHVLTKTWNKDEIYTQEMEEANQKRYLAVLMRAILKRCGEKLITFESNLSANGYENDGILTEYFDELINF